MLRTSDTFVCDLCGERHNTSSCSLFEPRFWVFDQGAPSRARSTLPSSLHLSVTDETQRIISLGTLQEGTQFGPFEAPRRQKLKFLPRLPFWVMSSRGVGEFLDTSEENLCNWMCLVRPAASSGESNVMAFQALEDIFFRTTREIRKGEELLLSYSTYYSKKMDLLWQLGKVAPDERSSKCSGKCAFHCRISSSQILPESVNRAPEGRQAESDTPTGRSRRKATRPARLKDFEILFPDDSAHEEDEQNPSNICLLQKEIWKCSQCHAVYDSGVNFAHHFQSHFSDKTIQSDSILPDISDHEANSPVSCSDVNEEHLEGRSQDILNCETSNSPHNSDLLINSDSVIYQPEDRSDGQTGGLAQLLPPVETASQLQSSRDRRNRNCSSALKRKRGRRGKLTSPCRSSTTKKLRSKYIEPEVHLEIEDDSENTSENDGLSGCNEDPDFQVPEQRYNTRANKKIVRISEVGGDPQIVSLHENALPFQLEPEDRSDGGKLKKRNSEIPVLSHTDFHDDRSVTSFSEELQDALDNTSHKRTSRRLNSSCTLSSKGKKQLISDIRKKYSKYSLRNTSSSGFNCDICGKHFSTSFYLYRHTKKHTGDFTCSICKRTFARNESLINHKCTANYSLECPKCKRTFCWKSLLDKHMRLHSKPFKCENCKKGFSTKDMLLKHACSNSKQVSNCPVCKKQFANSFLMTKHLPVHTGQFSCPLCSKWLCSSFAAYSHLLNCKDVKEIRDGGSKKCPVCSKVFTSVQEYRSHEYSHTHGFECKNCNAHFISAVKLQTHKCTDIQVPCPYCNKMFDGIPKIQTHICPKFSNPYQCLLCKIWFKESKGLREHKCAWETHFEKAPSINATDLLICDQCGKSFATVSSLNAHKVVHGEKKFSCNICSKSFYRKDQLENHGLKHTGPTVPCLQCGKLFKSKRNMIVHARIHSTAKQFCCSMCPKTFHQKGNLQKHEQTHVTGRAYECGDCGKIYKSRESYVKHRQLHEKGIRVPCSYCDKAFANRSQLKCHVNLTHFHQAFKCKYCGLLTRMRHSMTRHLSKKHADFASEWRNREVVDSMCTNLEKESKDNEEMEEIDDPTGTASGTDDTLDDPIVTATQEIVDAEDKPMSIAADLDEMPKLDLVEDMLCVEEVVQSSLDLSSDIQGKPDDQDLNLSTYERIVSVENDGSVQNQVFIPNAGEQTKPHIEKVKQKFQEPSGTVILEDGTIIQQPLTSGSGDMVFYVISSSESTGI